jgi:hypothetical protein
MLFLFLFHCHLLHHGLNDKKTYFFVYCDQWKRRKKLKTVFI